MTLQLGARQTPAPSPHPVVIIPLGGTLFAFCSPLCSRRYRDGRPAITVHYGASNGCWLCGRSLTEGSTSL